MLTPLRGTHPNVVRTSEAKPVGCFTEGKVLGARPERSQGAYKTLYKRRGEYIWQV